MSLLTPDDALGPTLSVVDLEFSDFGRRLALSRGPFITATRATAPPQGGGPDSLSPWRRVRGDAELRPASLARLLLRADVGRLRMLLARDEPFVVRLDDSRVRDAVARLIQRGSVGLFERSDVDHGSLHAAAIVAPELARPEQSASTAARRTPSPSPSPSPAAAAAPAPIAERPDWSESFDAQAMAEVLILAAQRGAPFCEECARRAARRGKPVAA